MKLYRYGIRGNVLSWITSYLSQRKISTMVNGTQSCYNILKTGVFQGTVLGPILFTIYMNDIADNLSCDTILYADDIALTIEDDSEQSLQLKSNFQLDKLNSWLKRNGLILNGSKSYVLLFYKNAGDYKVNAGEIEIKQVLHTKYLGITIDKKRNWCTHIELIIKNLKKYFSIFYNIRHFLLNEVKTVLFYSCIISKIQYCSGIYLTTASRHINSLNKLYNSLQKVLFNLGYNFPTRKIQKATGIPTLKQIYMTNKLKLAHQLFYNNDKVPRYLNNYFEISNNKRYNKFMINCPKYKKGNILFNIKNSWNNLPNGTTRNHQIRKFNECLKEHCLQTI